MSQLNLQVIIRQQQKQLTAMQVQIQALLTGGVGTREGGGGGTEVAKLQIFDGMSLKVARFITAYKLYIRMKLREEPVERQVQ